MYIGMWDPRISGEDLLAAVCDELGQQGARVDRGSNAALIYEYEPPLPPSTGEGARLLMMQPRDAVGGLVQLSFSLAEIDEEYDWREFNGWTAALIDHIRPALLTVATEWSAESLPNPNWSEAVSLFLSGWVNLQVCTETQRARFQQVADDGLAYPLSVGIRWPTERRDDLPWSEVEIHDIAARTYHAWTGEEAPQLETSSPADVTAEDLASRQLWFWSCNVSAGDLVNDVNRGIGPRGLSAYVWDYGQLPPWPFVIAEYLPQGRSVADLIDDLREVVAEIAPSWAGVQPKSGFLMPGPDTDYPGMSIVTHPWVSRSWIGSDLERLDAALAGCHREEIGGGILWVTDPDLVPDGRFADVWYDHHERFERLSQAAEILGQAARRSVGMVP